MTTQDNQNAKSFVEKRWLIWSIEHGAWWMPNRNGYTTKRNRAGKYTYYEALAIVESANIGLRDTPNEAMILREVDEK